MRLGRVGDKHNGKDVVLTFYLRCIESRKFNNLSHDKAIDDVHLVLYNIRVSPDTY